MYQKGLQLKQELVILKIIQKKIIKIKIKIQQDLVIQKNQIMLKKLIYQKSIKIKIYLITIIIYIKILLIQKE